MRPLLKFLFLLGYMGLLFSIVGCDESHETDTDIAIKTFALNQDFEVGDLRAIITEQIFEKAQINYCFGSNPGQIAFLIPGPLVQMRGIFSIN